MCSPKYYGLNSSKITRSRRRRTASATVEFAVCLPVLALLIFGSIEICNLVFLKQALSEAAYQGALAAMKPHATQSQVESRINGILDARNIGGTTSTLADGNFHSLAAGDDFTVEVSAAASVNALGPSLVGITVGSVSSTVTAVKQ